MNLNAVLVLKSKYISSIFLMAHKQSGCLFKV